MSVEMNQTIVDASLDKLHDIIVPDAIGIFPLAHGWYLLLLLLLSLLFHLGVQAYVHFKKNHYRKEALKELDGYKNHNKEELIKMIALAKRVGISAYTRVKTAQLSQEHWWDFMEAHSDVKIGESLRKRMVALLYDRDYRADDALFGEVKELLTLWIKSHKVARDV